MTFSSYLRLSGLVLAFTAAAAGQVSPEEHEQHHPEETTVVGQQGAGGDAGGGMMGGGMMGEMMQNMGAPRPRELYPRLMELPDLPLEERAVIESDARQRMLVGVRLMSSSLDAAASAALRDDYAAMQTAADTMREGIAQFRSGLAALRALREGKAPRNVAMQWFKRELSLVPPAGADHGFRLWGMDAFHTSVMAALVLFSVSVIWMYFFKMRRATALLLQLETQSKAPAHAPPTSATVARETKPSRPGRWSGRVRVAQIFGETPHVKTFRFVPCEGVAMPFTFAPGQFLQVCVNVGGKSVKRAYTIASSPTQRGFVEITVKREEGGLVSRFLHDDVGQGEVLDIEAPSGSFVFDGSEAESVVLIAGGVGITPMMSITRYLTDRCWPGEIFLVACFRSPEEYIFRSELDLLSTRHSNLHVSITMTRDVPAASWRGPRGRFTPAFLQEQIPDLPSQHIHVCGPAPMIEAVKAMLSELAVPSRNVKVESFGSRRKGPGEPSPSGAHSASDPAIPSVAFRKSGKKGSLPPDRSILEAAAELDVEIDSSCRSGTCGMCKVRLLEGTVAMDCEDSLEADEKAEGMILACQAKSTGDNVVIDA